jgi:predicted TIM-barrel fold metal-dependent hydrolase
MTLIDWHTHVWLPEHLGSEFGPGLDRGTGRAVTAEGDFASHEQAMRDAGVACSIVLALKSRHLGIDVPNDFVAEYVSARPDSTVGFACVDPNESGAVKELRHAANELGLRGLKLAPPYQAFHPDAPEAWAVYRAAAELGLVLLFHQGAVFTPSGVMEVANPILLDKLARELPELRIVIAHMGNPWHQEVIALMFKHANLYTDISARTSRPNQLRAMLLAATDYGVHDRVLFGSDYPVFHPRDSVAQLRAVNAHGGDGPEVPEAVIEDILERRPLSLLGL